MLTPWENIIMRLLNIFYIFSTGTGRSGVFLALDLCMREYDESKSIDILQCVSQLRRDRGGAVQNKDQYILIHEVIINTIVCMLSINVFD